MADLNTLNNKQLREKCLEYGLPNVPVTDSSRNVLIKRLQAIMSGKTPKTASKAASPKNRRKTVAATITTTISSGDEDDITATSKRTSNASRRRTTAPTVPEAKQKNNLTSTAAPKTYTQHVLPMNIESRASSTRINDSYLDDQRKRRSESLSKTGILTTSYSQETIPLRKTYEHNGEEDFEEIQEDEVDDIEMESIPNLSTIPNYSEAHSLQSNYAQNNYIHPSYNANNFITQTMPPPPEPAKPRLYPNLQSTGLQNDYYNSLDDILASHSSSVRQSKLGYAYNPPTSYIPTSPKPLSPTSKVAESYGVGLPSLPIQNANLSTQTSATKRYTAGGATKRHTSRTIDDEQGASSSDDQYEAPFLSKFSRNLENLQPDALAKRTTTSYSTTASPTIASRYSSYSPTAPKRRRGTYENETDITFAQFWAKIEEKYHLKQTLFFIMCFVAAVFIYVFFLQ